MNRTLKALYALLPAGAFGASVTLAALPAQAAIVNPNPEPAQPQAQPEKNVAARLQSIRYGVSAIAREQNGNSPEIEKVWWGNGGWGWGNGGGWGWHNGGWGNGWRNGGWGNGWHNWGNGWHNGWGNW